MTLRINTETELMIIASLLGLLAKSKCRADEPVWSPARFPVRPPKSPPSWGGSRANGAAGVSGCLCSISSSCHQLARVTLPRSRQCFPCWERIRGGQACVFPRAGNPGRWGPPCSPGTLAMSDPPDINFKKMLHFEFKGLWGTLKARSKEFLPEGDPRPL